MKINYPDSLDILNLRPDRNTRNSAESSPVIRPDDILYMIDELQKKVGANNSTDPASLESRVAALESKAEVQSASAALQKSAITALKSLTEILSLRCNKSPATSGPNAIHFTAAIRNDYIIIGNCYTGSGELAGYTVSDQTPEGFTVTVDQDGTFEWMAVQVS